MGLVENIRSVTWVRKHGEELLEQVNRTRSHVVMLRRSKPVAVVRDFASHERDRKALAMPILLGQSEREAAAGRTIPQEEVFRRIENKLQRRTSKCKSRARG